MITASADIDPSCIGQATGQIALDVHYYPGSYSILWSNGATTATITGLAAGSYTVTITDTELGCATLTETYNVGDVPCSNAFILTKTVNDEFTYSGAPILYTITVCNGTATTQDVELTDSGLSNFVHTSIALNGAPFAWPGFPSSPVTLPNVPAGGCATLEVSGYFTAIGTYTNCATADPANEDPVSNCAEPVVVQQNCPLMVSGWGDCVNGPVHLCLSEHSLIVDIKTLDFRWIFPEFLAPPTLGGAIVPVAASGLDPASSISAELPWTSMPGWSYVEVHLVFNNAISTAGSSTLLCVDVNYDGPVTPLQNVFQTFATNAAPYTINNHVTLLDGGGAPIQPGGFWTQAANIILTGCPGIEGPDASFTIDQVLCTGEVSVNGSLTDPNAIHMWTWGDERTTPTNGAQSYTYNYFEAIPLNQTPAYSVPPAPPGTYTITHTVILNGVASSSTQTVTLYACCQADQVITHGKLASAVPGPLTGTVDIQGQFILDQDFTFDNATVYMEPGAEILVQDGINLWVNESTIESCQDVLWKGITTGDGCIVQVRYSTIADAEHGIQARNSSIVLADESEFKNNRVGIEVPFVNQFNSVAIHSANCTYHAEGPLKQPYPGQVTAVGATGYAALDVNNMSLDFTGGGNVIRDLSNGIVGFRSDLNVADCSIHDIKPDAAYEHYANGSGIYARGPKAFRTLKQYGYGQSGAPSFQNCHWGIYAEHMNVYSWDNNMVNVGTAYRVDRSGYKDVHIHHNTVDTRRDGIVLHMNDGAAQVLVESNDITFAQNLPIGQYTKGYYAIRVFEANTLNPNSVIKNNIIHYRPGVTTAYGGIGLVSARKYLVANNALHMSDNASNYVGVLLNGCDDPEVSCNEVFGANNGYPNLGQSGVRNFMGNNAIISCNTVDNTTNGMLFSGWAINTDLKGNEFNNHRWGLHLENGAVIGTQTRTGNLWNQPAPQNGWQAWHENATDASQHKFYFDPTVPNTEPPSHEPIYWFQQDPGQTYSCAPGVNYCDQFGERCVGCPKEIYERIADGTLENGDYTDQTRWTMKGDLYDILKEAPQLRNDPELEAFYNTVQSTVLAAQKDMNDERIALYDIDASVLGQVVQNREQLLVLQGELKLALEQLAAPDLTAAQRTTLNGVITGLQQTMDGLISYNTAALELAANTRALSAESVKNTNAAIGATELTETNYKTVHAIYLSTVAKDVEGFTAQQAQDLLAVADQCPLVGGNAVFQARALYYAIDPEQEFDDPALCLQHGLVTKSLKQPVVNALSMVPNPAMDEVTLVLTAALEEAGTLLICNAQGAEVLRLRVPKDQQRTAVSVATLAPGVYHYRVLGVTGDLGAGKLSIVR
ncbi:MAG: hypothetical protein H6592_14725 [Flavobacteriales bacterium]|nr:hypothetical protein [Flavobacteriales bacterium]